MTNDKEEAEKRELQKLLREYDGNKGMAGLVCGRPVELMPQSEQDRIFNGFCTPGNLRVLSDSRKKLAAVKNLSLTEEEEKKISAAIPTLDGLVEAFTAYASSKLSKEDLRTKVREILHQPIPESQEDLINSLSHLIEMLIFLADQKLDTKDAWDWMVDCVQMHDGLSRTKSVCSALQALNESGSVQMTRSEAIDETTALTTASLDYLETFFRGEEQGETLQGHFEAVSAELREIWVNEEEESH